MCRKVLLLPSPSLLIMTYTEAMYACSKIWRPLLLSTQAIWLLLSWLYQHVALDQLVTKYQTVWLLYLGVSLLYLATTNNPQEQTKDLFSLVRFRNGSKQIIRYHRWHHSLYMTPINVSQAMCLTKLWITRYFWSCII